MNDISNKNTKIMYPEFRKMSGYHFLFQTYYNHPAENIPVDEENTITQARYQEMLQRVKQFTITHGNIPPLYVTINPNNSCYQSPRFLTGDDIKQSTNYFCACKISQQILYELYNIKVPETELAKESHTTKEGTSHQGIIDAITTEAQKHGHKVKIEFKYFKDTNWTEIGKMVANPDIGIFIHDLYKNRWGHYEYIIGVCLDTHTIMVANSLDGVIENRSFRTMEEYMSGIVQPSVGIVTNIPNIPVGYFINPDRTPLNAIDFTALKNSGISEVYIRATNSGSNIYTNLEQYYNKIIQAGLKPYAWTWTGFLHTKEVTEMGYHIVLDLETYNPSDYISEIQQVRRDSQNKTFIICTKPNSWDGDQRYDLLNFLCDYIMPMLYIGDYKKSVSQLEGIIEAYNQKYPKMYPALETYESDKNPIPKTNTALHNEINTIRPYVKGIALFRYGISNF